MAVALMLSFISQKRIAHKFDNRDQLVSDESNIPESQQDEMLVSTISDSIPEESMDSTAIEIDLKEMFGLANVPKPKAAENNILV